MLRILLTSLFFISVALGLHAADTKPSELKLKSLLRLTIPPTERFDLSGLLIPSKALKKAFRVKAQYFLINDKSSWIYLGRVEGSIVKIEPWLDLRAYYEKVEYDLEDIDSDGERLFVLNEKDSSVFEINPEAGLRKISVKQIVWKNPIESQKVEEPFGFEALGYVRPHLYLGNEKPPIAVYKLDPNVSVEKSFYGHQLRTNPLVQSQTAIRARRNRLYFLDREARCIWQTNDLRLPETCLSFAKVLARKTLDFAVRDDKKQDHPEWSTAEALDIRGSEFHIGLDNNGEALRGNPSEKRPTIVVLER